MVGLGRAMDGPSMSTGRVVGVMHGAWLNLPQACMGLLGASGVPGQVNRAITPPPGFPVDRWQLQGSVPGWSQLQHSVISMAFVFV